MNGVKRLTPPQSRKVNALVRRTCCNYDNGNCILLDDGDECVCPQLISYSLLCKWFRLRCFPPTGCFMRSFTRQGIRRNVPSAARSLRQPLTVSNTARLPETYHPQTSRRAHEEKTRPCYAVGAENPLIYRLSGRENRIGDTLYLYPQKWRSTA